VAAPAPAPPPDLERLFAAPLKEFVAERDRAARALKAAGRAAEAKEVARLPRPSIPVWVVNQLARRQPELVARLLDATEELRRAQQEVLSEKGTRPRYAESTAAHRDALARLRDAAGELLASSGHAAASQTIESVMRILRAGAASDAQRSSIRDGRLVGDVEEPDLSDLMGQWVPASPAAAERAPAAARPPVAAPEPPAAAATSAAERARAAAEEAARARQAREEARERARAEAARRRQAERARAEAARRVTELRAEARAADRAREAAQAAADVARQRLHDAEAKADAARAASDDVARQLAEAETALRSLPEL